MVLKLEILRRQIFLEILYVYILSIFKRAGRVGSVSFSAHHPVEDPHQVFVTGRISRVLREILVQDDPFLVEDESGRHVLVYLYLFIHIESLLIPESHGMTIPR